MRIQYLDGPKLRDALIAASDHVQGVRGELNRINVFPVPDGDTGTNLALTLRSIADGLRSVGDASVAAVAKQAAEAGILGARGNCGMIFSHFLLGFSDQVASRTRLSAAEFSQAMRGAVDHLYRALERPVEGTIVTVMREAAEEAARVRATDFTALFDRILERARTALARTPELLPDLRNAGVVDAGAKGFVHVLEGMAGFLSGRGAAAVADSAHEDGETTSAGREPAAAAAAALTTPAETYRFCTEALVRGEGLPGSDEVRRALASHGDSVVVIGGDGLLKVHVHTDDPEAVFGYLRGLGELATHKAEDMHAQHKAVARAASAHITLARRPVGVVTDSGCDLPDEVLQAHGIRMVPLSLVYEDKAYRDRVDIDAATFVARMRSGEHPGTSQPTPASFLEAYRDAARDAETLVTVPLASALSGTFASAETAAHRFDDAPVRLVDSRGASILQGLLVLRAAELAEAGLPAEEIVEEIRRVRDRSGILFTVDSLDRLQASGRIGRAKALLGTLLNIKPILALDDTGKVVPADTVRGRENVLPRVLDMLEQRIPDDAEHVRFGIVHVGCEAVLDEIRAGLRERFGDREVITAPATPVIATHIGLGAWAVAYLVED